MTGPLLRTPLYQAHRDLGAKMVDYGGWDMPLVYGDGTLAEHTRCRTEAVVFDVSHLGTVRVEGADAYECLQRSLTNDLGKVAAGRAQYTHLLDPADASVLDDIIVWWVEPHRFDVMPNASNTDRVTGALAGGEADHLSIEDVTATRAIVAVQGPDARARLAEVSPGAAAVAWEWTQMKRTSSCGQPNPASASMTERAVGPDVIWLAMAELVSCATMQAASRTLRSVTVMPVAFCESLMKPAGIPVSVTPSVSSVRMKSAISSTEAV